MEPLREGWGVIKVSAPANAIGVPSLHTVAKKSSTLCPRVFAGTRAYRTPGRLPVALAMDVGWGERRRRCTAGAHRRPLLTNQPCHLHALGDVPLGVDLRHAKLTVAEDYLGRLQAVAFADLGGCGVT